MVHGGPNFTSILKFIPNMTDTDLFSVSKWHIEIPSIYVLEVLFFFDFDHGFRISYIFSGCDSQFFPFKFFRRQFLSLFEKKCVSRFPPWGVHSGPNPDLASILKFSPNFVDTKGEEIFLSCIQATNI